HGRSVTPSPGSAAGTARHISRGRLVASPVRGLGLGHDFDRLWIGESVSALGSQLTALALPTFAIFELHVSAFALGVLPSCTFAGYPLVGILGATIVDRYPRRTILLCTNAVRALVLIAVPVSALAGPVPFGELCVVALVVSGCTSLFDAAYQAILPAT